MQLCFQNFSKEKQISNLFDCIKFCNICNRMVGRNKILSESNGNINAKIMFIAEAPGRFGADKTHIPLFGDKSGSNFELLLSNIGWRRDSVFITNSVLCNPREINGANATPTIEELSNCSIFLQMTINIVNPDVIVTLGSNALKGLCLIKGHSYNLKSHVRKLLPWNGRHIFITYHPGQRGFLHRCYSKQLSDFYALSKIANPNQGLIEKRKRNSYNPIYSNINPSLLNTIAFLADNLKKISKFKLTKLLYLIDLNSFETFGKVFTGAKYIRQVDGPWPPILNEALKTLNGYEILITFNKGKPYISRGPSPRLEFSLQESHLNLILRIIDEYAYKSDAMVKSIVYKTAPMRHILFLEQIGNNCLNKCILE